MNPIKSVFWYMLQKEIEARKYLKKFNKKK
jgi:hypothetical protein